MALKMLQVTAPLAAEQSIRKISEKEGVISFHKDCDTDDDHAVYSLLADSAHRQQLVDDLQNLAKMSSRFRINIFAVDTTIPTAGSIASVDTREELLVKMERGAQLDFNYLLLTFLSTLVAIIGLLQDNIAVVVGAMVIAPFLGPNLAFAFATSLGNQELMRKAFLTGTIGVGFAVLVSAAYGFFDDGTPVSQELMSRTSIGMDGVALAVASGVAGVLSLTSGLSMTLVGVMVAVAILPPAVTFGYMAGAGELKLAYGALLMVSVNIVCVNLSGLMVFLAKGIKPRLWFERRMAKPYVVGGIAVWSALLGLMVFAIKYPLF